MPASPFKNPKKSQDGLAIHVEDVPGETEMGLNGEAAGPTIRKSSLISGSSPVASKAFRPEVPPLPKGNGAEGSGSNPVPDQADMNSLSKQLSDSSLNMKQSLIVSTRLLQV